MTSRLELTLPEPPTLNAMLDLAKQRTYSRRLGRAIPIVYDATKADYQTMCRAQTRTAGVFPPRVPWPRWQVEAVTFRIHTPRDAIELLAGLKWPIDWLVMDGFVLNDSPRELVAIAMPAQYVERNNRGVDLVIARLRDAEAA